MLGLPVVRLESRHTLCSWRHPYLVGKVLAIAPDSHFGLVEFHPISVSSAFRVFELSGCGPQQQQCLQVRTGSAAVKWFDPG